MWGERGKNDPDRSRTTKTASKKSRQRDRRISRATLRGVQPQTKPEMGMMGEYGVVREAERQGASGMGRHENRKKREKTVKSRESWRMRGGARGLWGSGSPQGGTGHNCRICRQDVPSLCARRSFLKYAESPVIHSTSLKPSLPTT